MRVFIICLNEIVLRVIIAFTTNSTLVNVYVDLVAFTRIAGTLKTGSGRYWP